MPSSVASLPMVNPSSPSTDAIETALRKIDSRVFTPRVRLTFVLGWGIFIVVIIARPFVLLQGHWRGVFTGRRCPETGTRAGGDPPGSRGGQLRDAVSLGLAAVPPRAA